MARSLRVRLPGDLGWYLEDIAGRGVRIVFVFARTEPGIELLRLQAGISLDRLGERVRLHVIEEGDQVFSKLGPRRKLKRCSATNCMSERAPRSWQIGGWRRRRQTRRAGACRHPAPPAGRRQLRAVSGNLTVVSAATSGYTQHEEVLHSLTALIGVVGIVISTPWLVFAALGQGNGRGAIGAAAFGLGALLMFGTSTLYHYARRPRVKAVLRRLDHSAIYLLIAGTYTPFTIGVIGGVLGCGPADRGSCLFPRAALAKYSTTQRRAGTARTARWHKFYPA